MFTIIKNKLLTGILVSFLSLTNFTNTANTAEPAPEFIDTIFRVTWFCSDLESTRSIFDLMSIGEHDKASNMLGKFISENKCYQSPDEFELPGISKCLSPELFFADSTGDKEYWCINEIRLPTLNWIFKGYVPSSFTNLEKT